MEQQKSQPNSANSSPKIMPLTSSNLRSAASMEQLEAFFSQFGGQQHANNARSQDASV
jgi:hypothetical protein